MKPLLTSFILHGLLLFLLFLETADKETPPPTVAPVALVEFVVPERPLRNNQKSADSRTATPVARPASSLTKNPLSPLVRRQRLPRVAPQATDTTSTTKTNDTRTTTLAAEQIALTYSQELNLFLRKNKKYPRRAAKLRQSGTVEIRVQITPQGLFKNIKVATPSQFKLLNSAATDLLAKLGRFKPLPPGYTGNGEFLIPVAYRLQGGRGR